MSLKQFYCNYCNQTFKFDGEEEYAYVFDQCNVVWQGKRWLGVSSYCENNIVHKSKKKEKVYVCCEHCIKRNYALANVLNKKHQYLYKCYNLKHKLF